MATTIEFLIPARNAASTLGQTLASLRAQTSPAWRALVMDDGSTDDTAAIAARVGDPRVSVERGPAAGVAAARNRAFERATAELVCFLDADDVIAPTFIARLTPAISEADAVSCGYAYAGPGLEPSGWTVIPGPLDHQPHRLSEVNPFAIGAIVFRRAALARLAATGPLFPTDSHHEDWELLLRFGEAGARWAAVVPEPLFTYRLRPDSRTTGLRAMWRDGLKVIHGHHPARSAIGPAQRRWTLRSLARALVRKDRDLAADMLMELGPLTAPDEGVLAGALRWSLRREAVSGAVADSGPAGLVRILECIIPADRARALAAQVDSPAAYWARVARAAADRLRPGRTLVLYGLGRNGRELSARLAALGVVHSVVDDHSPETGRLQRLAVSDLGPGHVVIVTPDERAGILARLRGSAAQVWLPEDLTKDPGEGIAA